MKRTLSLFLVTLLLVAMLGPTHALATDVSMTDVGTPRNETVVIDSTAGILADPYLVNPFISGSISGGAGINQCLYAQLWDINNQSGEQFPDMAAGFPEPIDDTMTKFRVKLREGMTWSDGVEITSDDVVFTADMLINNPELVGSSYFTSVCKSITAEDKYTFIIETPAPTYKLTHELGVVISNNRFRIQPKHVWEKEDPKSFKNSDPVCSGPYYIKDRDPQGTWMLFQLRDDWQNTSVGINAGQPKAKYILIKYFGTEEKRVMAAINNEIDMMNEITPESWDIIRQRNPDMMTWYANFPYATFDDPGGKGIIFNCAKAPYDNANVRWALALSIDMQSAAMSAYSGIIRLSPLVTPATNLLQEVYNKPMLDWLRDFELADGYKPFDDQQAHKLVEQFKEMGYEGLPEGDEAIVDTFGVGWWKFDPDQAEKLLTGEGFTKKDGKWYLPDGSLWTIYLPTPDDSATFVMKTGFAVADNWKKFGIDVQVKQLDFATIEQALAMGEYDVSSADGQFYGAVADTTSMMDAWHKKYIQPIGTRSDGYGTRWANDTVSELLDQAKGVAPTDPQIEEIVMDIQKEFVKEMPAIPMFGGTKLNPFNYHYWKNWPSDANAHYPPWFWHSIFKYILTEIEPTGAQ